MGIRGFHPEGTVVAEFLGGDTEAPINQFASDYFYEDWIMFPFNPHWEWVDIFVPTGGRLHQVVIDTISFAVPVPAAVWAGMSLLGGLGFLGAIRRKLRSCVA